jgi:hypothetical protein
VTSGPSTSNHGIINKWQDFLFGTQTTLLHDITLTSSLVTSSLPYLESKGWPWTLLITVTNPALMTWERRKKNTLERAVEKQLFWDTIHLPPPKFLAQHNESEQVKPRNHIKTKPRCHFCPCLALKLLGNFLGSVKRVINIETLKITPPNDQLSW